MHIANCTLPTAQKGGLRGGRLPNDPTTLKHIWISSPTHDLWCLAKAFRYPWPRTALLLRTEMSILRDDTMRPLFQEAIVTKLAVTQVPQGTKWKLRILSFQWYPMSLYESRGSDTIALQSWAYYQNKLKCSKMHLFHMHYKLVLGTIFFKKLSFRVR